MTETGIIALVGVVATLLSGFGASLLSNRHSSKRDAERVRAEAQVVMRQIIVGALVESRLWLGESSSVAIISATADNAQALDRYLTSEMGESEAAEQLAKYGNGMRRSLTEAQLVAADSDLFDALETVRSLHGGWWSECLKPIRANFDSKQPDVVERMFIWHSYRENFAAAISDLEDVARERLAVKL